MIVLLALEILPAIADLRSECRRACGRRISACLAATTPFGFVGKGCARAVWKKCVTSGIETCQTTTTTTTTSTTLDSCAVDLLATGQRWCADTLGEAISCAGTGEDGDLQTGVTHAYVDNGDGTITDLRTHLMWEKLSDDGTVHDKDAWGPGRPRPA